MKEYKSQIINTVCPRNCYSSCGMEVHMMGDKIIKIKGSERNEATRGKLCLKGRRYLDMIDNEERLLYPLKRVGKRGIDNFQQITWEEVIEIIYYKFSKLINQFGAKSLLYYQGSGNHGGIMQEYAYGFWYQLGGYSTVRGNLCDPAGVAAIKYTFGTMKHSALSEIEKARLIIIWGKNPSFTHTHSMYHIQKAKKNGAKLVIIDPRKNESSGKCDLLIQPRAGMDGLLAHGIAKLLIKDNGVNTEFVKKYIKGYETYTDYLEGLDFREICRLTELDISIFEQLSAYIIEAGTYTLILGKGLQRYSNGGQTIRAIISLSAITGSIGKTGCGIYFNDGQRPKQKWPYYPPKPTDIRDNINMGQLSTELTEINSPPIKAMWVQGANPMTSNPNRNKLRKAMDSLDFIVVAEQFMTDTARMADLVLPVSMFLEDNDIVHSYGHSYLQLKQKVVDSPGECLSDKAIFYRLGQRFGMDMRYLPKDDKTILKKVIEESGYMTSLEELEQNPYLFKEYEKLAYKNLIFDTPSGKIELYSKSIAEDWNVAPIPVYTEPYESKYTAPELYKRYPLQFMSLHAKERINSQFGQVEKLNILSKISVQIHPDDATSRNIANGDRIRIYNNRGEIYVEAEIMDTIKVGHVNVFEGRYESTGASVNALTDDRTTDIGHGAAFHNCLVEIEKVNK